MEAQTSPPQPHPQPSHRSPTIPLDAGEPALGAFRRVLANLAGTMEENRQGTLDDLDPEFLHQFRVAVRRSRSVLGESKRVVPAPVRDRYGGELRWLGAVTGPARDLDVWVIEWDGYVEPLGPAAAGELGPVLALLAERRRVAHADLEEALRSERYRALVDAWTAWLGAGAAGGGRQARRPVGEVAGDRIARAQERVLRRGRSIDAATPAEVLHDLRKDAKRLRYLLECFGGLYPAAGLKAFVRRLKALQDNLGEHQDTEVHAAQLRSIRADLESGAGVGAATLDALAGLADALDRRGRAAREEFAGRFAAYDTEKTARALAELTAPPGAGG